MGATAKQRATYQDVLNAPEGCVAEIVDGELHTSPRPSIAHGLVSSALGGELYAPFQRGRGGPGGWWILDEPELHLGDFVLVPDLAGWRRERLPHPPRAPAITLAPDWICEVISPSTGGLDRVKKLPAYASTGVEFAWLIDPDQRTLEVYRNEKRGWLLLATHGGNECVRAVPFEAIELELDVFWGGRDR